MKPRVVILSAFLTPFRSGAEACAEEVARELSATHDIAIVTARLRRDLPRESMLGGVRVTRVGIGSGIDKWLFPFLAPLAARRHSPQVIHAVLESYAGLAMVLCRWLAPGTKRVLTCQSTNTSLLVGAMHRSAHAVTVISSVLKTRAAGYGRTDAVLIPNGIRYALMRRACDGVPKAPGRVLFVGRLERVKGVDIFLRALAVLRGDIRRAHLRPSVHIVGDGFQRGALEALARSLGLAESVRFLGRLDPPQLWREYAEAEIFCGLSRSEALGNVFLEAQTAECAVLATRVGGIPDVVKDGETGMLVRSEDPEDAAEALEKLLSDREWQRTLGSAGPKNAEHYDWSGIAAKYADVYGRLMTAS